MLVIRVLLTLALGLSLAGEMVYAYTANKVWFEFRPDGRYRVHVVYTIPEVKELRESWIDFNLSLIHI